MIYHCGGAPQPLNSSHADVEVTEEGILPLVWNETTSIENFLNDLAILELAFRIPSRRADGRRQLQVFRIH